MRLTEAELELTQRRAEALWGSDGGPDMALAVRQLRRDVGEGKETEGAPARVRRKTKWKGQLLPDFFGTEGEDDGGGYDDLSVNEILRRRRGGRE